MRTAQSRESEPSPFHRFESAMKAILSVSKKDVDKAMAAEKKKRAKQRKKRQNGT